jgi:hypothetical protein
VADADTTLEQYQARHRTPPIFATVAPQPESLAAQQATLATAKQGLAAAQQTYLRNTGTTGEAAASDAVTAAQKAVQTAQQDYNKMIGDAAAKTSENQNAAILAQNAENAKAWGDIQAGKRAADLETQRGKQAIDLQNVTSGNQTSAKLLDEYNTDAKNSGTRIDDLQLLRGLSENAGTPTLLTSIKIGNRSLADIISGTGYGGKDLSDKVAAVQAFRSGVMNVVRDLRSGGAAAGEPRSNQDLSFVQDMAPNEWQDPNTRSAIISMLQQINQRRIDMAAEVARLSATRLPNGMPMPAGQAVAQARENLPPMVPQLDKPTMDAGGAGLQTWFEQNVRPYTFFRYPNGRMDLYKGPPQQPQTITVRPRPQ